MLLSTPEDEDICMAELGYLVPVFLFLLYLHPLTQIITFEALLTFKAKVLSYPNHQTTENLCSHIHF